MTDSSNPLPPPGGQPEESRPQSVKPSVKKRLIGFRGPRISRYRAYAVHIYTASNAVWAFFATLAVFKGDYREAFFWNILAVVIDATDGFWARRWEVKKVVPEIDGRTIDDIADYLVYTFVPMLMVWHAGWLPAPVALWASLPLVASLFTFGNVGAKEEGAGYFLGFPSYWNIFAFYAGLWYYHHGPWLAWASLLVLCTLSVLPVRFVYPNQARHWRYFFLHGSIVWLLLGIGMLPWYPHVPAWLVWLSLLYPAGYFVGSFYWDWHDRKATRFRAG